ncbi:MAG: 16S rRNA (guanine(527)-N(7))-methyltransferase RsmG [Candidatus Hydrogenedentes bacterium]|nr:16S rRNA (guanine(527)-N(7))-methyltransferase RsmG [Candidatus Hydrogenedentota bacterium]
MRGKLEQYIELLLEWNSFAGLISKTDEDHIVSRHLVDSLSLVKMVEAASGPGGSPHLDIGAGGGFPAIPMAIALPEVEFVAIERSARKSTFLRKAASDLSLSNLRIIPGMFPEKAPDERPSTITARAVENPERVFKSILDWLPSGCTFLCQFPNPQDRLPVGFDCTVVHDTWTEKGYRRGTLHLIRRID